MDPGFVKNWFLHPLATFAALAPQVPTGTFLQTQ